MMTLATSECPHLKVKKEGSYEFNYYCDNCYLRKIGDTYDKKFVEDVCRCGEYYYEDCYAYNHDGSTPGLPPDAPKVWGKRSSTPSSASSDTHSSSDQDTSTSFSSRDRDADEYSRSRDSSSSTSGGSSGGDYSIDWGRIIFWGFVVIAPFLLVLGIIDVVQYFFHSGVTDRHNHPYVEVVSENKVHVGDILNFGSYEQDMENAGLEDIEWIVLDKDGDRILMVSRYVLDCQQFNIYNEETSWETCSLRRWLNWTFYDAAFTDSEKAMILTTTLGEDYNPLRKDRVCNSTNDKVFLLSLNEANRYFASDSKRECHPTDYAKAMGVTALRKFYFTCNWWLRTPGAYNNTASLVFNEGEVYKGDAAVALVTNDNIGVRPAIWVVLDPAENNSEIEPDLWYVGDDEQKDPFSDDWASTTVWPGSKPVDLVTLAQNRLSLNYNGSNNIVRWESGPVRDAYSNEYQGFLSLYVSDTREQCPDITLDPGGENMVLDAWFFVAGNSVGRGVRGGSTDSEDLLGLRFYGDDRQIYDTGLIRSVDGAYEMHLDLSGIKALRIELYAGGTTDGWVSSSYMYLTGAVHDKKAASALPEQKEPQRPDPVTLTELAERYVASNWRAPEGNFSDFTSNSVSDPRGNTYTGCLYFGMSKHNESAPWYMLDLGGVYRSLDFKCFVSARNALQKGPDDKFGLRFYGDGSQIFDTGYISGDMSARSFHVDVKGFKTLRIELYTASSTSRDARLYLVDGILSK